MLVSGTLEAPIINGAQQTIFDLVEKKKNTLIRVNALIFWSLFAKVAQYLAAERKSGFIAANRRSVVVPLLEDSLLEKRFTNALELTKIPMNEHTPQFREISDDIRRRSIVFFESKFTGGETVRHFNDCLTKTKKLKRKEKKEKKRSKNTSNQLNISKNKLSSTSLVLMMTRMTRIIFLLIKERRLIFLFSRNLMRKNLANRVKLDHRHCH